MVDKNKFNQIKEPNKLISYWKKEKLAVILIIISGVFYNVGLLLGPILQGKLIDALILKESSKYIIILSSIFIASIAIVQSFRYVKRFYVRRFANNISAAMRTLLYNNLLNKTKLQLEYESMGSLMTKSISDVDVCVEGMRKFTTEVFDTGVFLIAYIIYMLFYDVKITLISCFFIPVAILIAEKLKKVIYKFTSDYRKKLSSLSQTTYEQIDNALLFRLYGQEEDNNQSYNEQIDKLNKSAVLAHVWENSMQPIYNVIAMMGVIIVITLGGKNVIYNIWTVGQFSSFLVIFTTLAFKASKTAKLFNSIQKASVSWKRIKPYLDNSKTIDKTIYNKFEQIDIKIIDLKFSYPKRLEIINNNDKTVSKDNSNLIIDGLNLDAFKGQIIGVTGPIACGKSTIGRLFLGEYNYDGHIYINNVELSSLSEFERSTLISYVGHNPSLITDTIYNNITLGEDGGIEEILKIVCLDNEINAMKNGIDTVVGNSGVRLSGGQQARVSLARCLYHKTPILILDDPFSAVDIKTENDIISNIKLIYKEQIIILISHRLKIFTQLDNIILINNNKTYEYGNHQELIKSSSLYHELFNLQASEDGENNEK
ncbi:ABC transporter ATP-binding protein [Sedimentibacter sp. zth1]|uniref:ABC transporter ATP-binding protein n=1 Tax=Sedimentibacter sp. zth1 TaxID=2816908 RepID=UPI001A92C3ED|nr:ABC transporter ATP-binding protein [Sedimentibacter sp. zth1]QSX06774.1 ABC transporter ATP-binding protein [Sedimentibacter sp. zth1]